MQKDYLTRTAQLDERSRDSTKGAFFIGANFKNSLDVVDVDERRHAAARVQLFQEHATSVASLLRLHDEASAALFKQVDSQKERILQLYDSMCDTRSAFRNAVKMAEASRFEYEATLLNVTPATFSVL